MLSCASNSNIQTLTKVQKKAIRIITNSTYLALTNPLFCQRKILLNPALIQYSNLKFMLSIIYEYSPSSFHTIWHGNEHKDINHDLRNANHLTIPPARIELFKKSLLYQLPSAWNNLDIGLQLQHNKCTFSNTLKKTNFYPLSVLNITTTMTRTTVGFHLGTVMDESHLLPPANYE
jgi:hypothetical protein